MNRFRTALAAAYLVLCLVLGGASAGGAIGNGVLQILAVIIILLHIWSRGAPPLPSDGRVLVLLFAIFAAVAALQLVPLAPALWGQLPGRDVAVRSLALLRLDPATMPASLDPRRTLASLLWLLPPTAMFLVATRLTRDERSVVAKVLLAVAVATIALGALQLFGGSASPLRFYEITNPDRSVGFFSNANHVATLLLCSLPFAVLFVARAKKKDGGVREGRGFIYAGTAIFIAIGIAINGSLAGYGLLIPTAAASLFLYRRTTVGKANKRTWWTIAVAAMLFTGISAFGPLNDQRIASKFDGSNTVGRKISIPTTIEAAKDHLPIGSGLGTFRDIYRTYEPAADVTYVYVNHAHNDYAELALELGIPGLLLILAFLWWWGSRSVAAWRDEYHGAALARAGSIAIGVALLHSLVDYPLRTSAIAALIALCAGFMVQPPAARSRASRNSRQAQARHFDAETA